MAARPRFETTAVSTASEEQGARGSDQFQSVALCKNHMMLALRAELQILEQMQQPSDGGSDTLAQKIAIVADLYLDDYTQTHNLEANQSELAGCDPFSQSHAVIAMTFVHFFNGFPWLWASTSAADRAERLALELAKIIAEVANSNILAVGEDPEDPVCNIDLVWGWTRHTAFKGIRAEVGPMATAVSIATAVAAICKSDQIRKEAGSKCPKIHAHGLAAVIRYSGCHKRARELVSQWLEDELVHGQTRINGDVLSGRHLEVIRARAYDWAAELGRCEGIDGSNPSIQEYLNVASDIQDGKMQTELWAGFLKGKWEEFCMWKERCEGSNEGKEEYKSRWVTWEKLMGLEKRWGEREGVCIGEMKELEMEKKTLTKNEMEREAGRANLTELMKVYDLAKSERERHELCVCPPVPNQLPSHAPLKAPKFEESEPQTQEHDWMPHGDLDMPDLPYNQEIEMEVEEPCPVGRLVEVAEYAHSTPDNKGATTQSEIDQEPDSAFGQSPQTDVSPVSPGAVVEVDVDLLLRNMHGLPVEESEYAHSADVGVTTATPRENDSTSAAGTYHTEGQGISQAAPNLRSIQARADAHQWNRHAERNTEGESGHGHMHATARSEHCGAEQQPSFTLSPAPINSEHCDSDDIDLAADSGPSPTQNTTHNNVRTSAQTVTQFNDQRQIQQQPRFIAESEGRHPCNVTVTNSVQLVQTHSEICASDCWTCEQLQTAYASWCSPHNFLRHYSAALLAVIKEYTLHTLYHGCSLLKTNHSCVSTGETWCHSVQSRVHSWALDAWSRRAMQEYNSHTSTGNGLTVTCPFGTEPPNLMQSMTARYDALCPAPWDKHSRQAGPQPTVEESWADV